MKTIRTMCVAVGILVAAAGCVAESTEASGWSGQPIINESHAGEKRYSVRADDARSTAETWFDCVQSVTQNVLSADSYSNLKTDSTIAWHWDYFLVGFPGPDTWYQFTARAGDGTTFSGTINMRWDAPTCYVQTRPNALGNIFELKNSKGSIVLKGYSCGKALDQLCFEQVIPVP